MTLCVYCRDTLWVGSSVCVCVCVWSCLNDFLHCTTAAVATEGFLLPFPCYSLLCSSSPPLPSPPLPSPPLPSLTSVCWLQREGRRLEFWHHSTRAGDWNCSLRQIPPNEGLGQMTPNLSWCFFFIQPPSFLPPSLLPSRCWCWHWRTLLPSWRPVGTSMVRTTVRTTPGPSRRWWRSVCRETQRRGEVKSRALSVYASGMLASHCSIRTLHWFVNHKAGIFLGIGPKKFCGLGCVFYCCELYWVRKSLLLQRIPIICTCLLHRHVALLHTTSSFRSLHIVRQPRVTDWSG